MLERQVLVFSRKKTRCKRVSEGHEACFFVAEKQFDKVKKHAMMIVINYKIHENQFKI